MEKTKAFEISGPTLLPYSPIVLLRDILKRWLIILMAAVVVGVGDYILMDQTHQPVYKTDATLVITTQDSTSTVYSNLNSTSELAAVFASLLNSSVMQKTVLEELHHCVPDRGDQSADTAGYLFRTPHCVFGDPIPH